MKDKNSLERFTEAQERDYPAALSEIRNGRKQTHWMWYIFPQLRGIGSSDYAEYYGINGMEEAQAYLRNENLARNLREICEALLALDENDPFIVMGKPDDRKLRSCMTLFSEATDDNEVFLAVLDKFYSGEKCKVTLSMLGR